MTPTIAISIAVLVGIIGSSVVHLSKGIMKDGVVRRSTLLYLTGVAFNFTNPLWVIVANRFAPTVYYTSVYGLGLLALVLYGRRRLGETLSRRQLSGLLLIVFGTLIIGVSEFSIPQPTLYSASRSTLFLVAGAWIVGTPLIALVLPRSKGVLQEVFFGIAGGGFAALDAVAKGVAQAGADGSTFLPTSPENWLVFGLSFLGAAAAFGMIQWSYVRSCRASMMGASYDVAYVALPLFLVPVLLGVPMVGLWCIVGLACLAAGAVLSTQGGSRSASASSEALRSSQKAYSSRTSR
jgi:multidrug transporter EmrE-like cation transporter